MRRRIEIPLLIAALLCCVAAEPATTTTSPAAPTSQPVFDVKTTGATADGKTKDTAAIQKAIDQCAASGGGVVSLPAGAYLCGSLFLKSHVTLRIEKDALLQGSDDESDYPIIDTRVAGLEMKHPAALVNAIDCVDVAVVGAGTIDGAGKHWWDLFGKIVRANGRGADFIVLRPRLICFTRCQNVRVTGLYLANPPFWCLHILYSQNVDIDGLTIRAPARSPSSDGIDIDSSSDVRISRCDVACNDDDICVKAGRDADGLRVNIPSENITISDCTIGAGDGISMGSETAGSIRNVIVRRCTFHGTTEAARIKSMPGRGGVVENITYEDITATECRTPIEINLTWGGDDWKKFVDPKLATTVPSDLGTPHVRNITYRNFTANGGLLGGTIAALPNSPLENIKFENVSISAQHGLTIVNAPDLKLDGMTVEAKEGENVIRRSSTTQPR
ncbi:MAG TPA: glycoside hydrolase family 28 protein [Tepidisphaeraceae bacterium]|jgi:polygalacturonase|nr:glycoside hydrolase family 28 protein [Tepidisphaeraceae bacterium]